MTCPSCRCTAVLSEPVLLLLLLLTAIVDCIEQQRQQHGDHKWHWQWIRTFVATLLTSLP